MAERRGKAFGALKYRDFRFYWVGLIINHLGSWMQLTAQSWLLYEMTGSPALVGLNGLLRTLPFVLVSLYAGTLVDRVERKLLLMRVEAAQGVIAIGIGALAATGRLEVWHIYAGSILNSILGAFESPCQQSLLRNLVPAADLTTAYSMASTVRRSSQVVGPALGGLCVATIGAAGAFYVNGISYFGYVWCLWMVSIFSRGRESQARAWDALKEGFRYVLDQRGIAALLGLQAVISIFGSYQQLLVVFAKDIFSQGPEGLGLMQSALGAGSIVGSVGLASLGDVHHKGRLTITSSLVFASALIAYSFCPWYPLALLILAVMGGADVISGAMNGTIMQLMAERHMLGRVVSFSSITNRGLGPMGGFQTGVLAGFIGIQWATAAGAAVCLAALGFTALRVPAVSRFTGLGVESRAEEGVPTRAARG